MALQGLVGRQFLKFTSSQPAKYVSFIPCMNPCNRVEPVDELPCHDHRWWILVVCLCWIYVFVHPPRIQSYSCNFLQTPSAMKTDRPSPPFRCFRDSCERRRTRTAPGLSTKGTLQLQKSHHYIYICSMYNCSIYKYDMRVAHMICVVT